MWTIFKVFIEFVTILLLFYFLVLWPQGVWDLRDHRPGIEPTPPALEGEVLTTVPPGKPCRGFNDVHSDQCEVIPHCSFGLHFSNN